MLMYPDNAQRITAILNAIALPELRPHVIALGRPHSMLALRDWLDGGGLGGMLADRTLPGSEDQPAHQRGNNIVLPFLGQPASFNDGPFRLAALLRRKVFFMAGLYGGGARYDVRFDPLADFSEPPCPTPRSASGASVRRSRPTSHAWRRCAALTRTTGSTFMISGSKMRLDRLCKARS
jgi:predicted LPLAT superfamily acyltransferase